MFALRTPPKKGNASGADATQKALTPEKRSINETEPVAEIINKSTTESATVTPARSQKYKNRLMEAKACVTKAKLHLGNSRNIKTEIKNEVTQSIDRLYQLIKESEQEKGKAQSETQGPPPIEPRENNLPNEIGKLGDWMGVMRAELGNIAEAIQELTSPTPPKYSGNLRLEQVMTEIKTLRTEIGGESKRTNGKITTLQDEIKTMPNLSPDHTKSIDRLVEEVKGLRQKTEETYASVVASRPTEQTTGRTTLHSVVVTSRDETETGEEVLEKLRMAVDAKEGWVKIEKVRKGRDRKIIVGLKTKEEREKLKAKLEKDGALLNVEDVKNRDPLLILQNVMLYNSDDDVIKAIKKQNGWVFDGLGTEENRIEIKYRKRARNPLTGHIIVSTSSAIWKRITEAGSLHIDLQRVRVEDQSPLTQCTRCLGFGHGKKVCREPTDLCGHCGGPHLRPACPEWLADVPPKCHNCEKTHQPSTAHNAFSLACPIRKKWDDLARASVAYC